MLAQQDRYRGIGFDCFASSERTTKYTKLASPLHRTPFSRRRYHWVLASLGTIQIFAIIARATGGLEKRQAEKYGSSEDWKAYAALTPVLVPFTRQYTWGKRSSQ